MQWPKWLQRNDGLQPIRLTNENESALIAEIRIQPMERKPQMLYDGGVFLASRQLEDGTWIYRRVGREREA